MMKLICRPMKTQSVCSNFDSSSLFNEVYQFECQVLVFAMICKSILQNSQFSLYFTHR